MGSHSDHESDKAGVFEAPLVVVDLPDLKIEIANYKPEIEALLEQAKNSAMPVNLPGGKVVRAAVRPEPVPLSPEEQEIALAGGVLSPELKLLRWGKGLCAIRPDGSIAVNWFLFPLRSDRTFTYSWQRNSPNKPEVETMKIGDRSAIFIDGEIEEGGPKSTLMVRAGTDECWLIRGDLPKEELILLAYSLVSGSNN